MDGGDYRNIYEMAMAIDSPDCLGELIGAISRLEEYLSGLEKATGSAWTVASEKKWVSDAMAVLRGKSALLAAQLAGPIQVMAIPPALLNPPVPDGLGEGWYRAVPCQGGHVEVFIRAFDRKDCESLYNSINHPSAGKPLALPGVLEATLTIYSKDNIIIKGGDYFTVRVHGNSRYKVRPRNRDYLELATRKLGKDHPTSTALDIEEFELGPGKPVKKLLVYKDGSRGDTLDIFDINRIYCGEWPLHRTVPMLYPPGIELPPETVLQLVLPREAGTPGTEHSDPWTDRKKDWGKVDGGTIVSEGVEVSLRLMPKDELCEFYSIEPAFVPAEKGIAYVTAVCGLTGGRGLIDAEAVTNVHRGGASGITNVLPAWDPRGGPPDIPPVPVPTIVWRIPLEDNEPFIAVSGDAILVSTDEGGFALHSSSGIALFRFRMSGRLTAVYGGPGRFLVAHGSKVSLFDPSGREKFRTDLDTQTESLAVLPDGTILAGTDPYYNGALAIIDPAGKVQGTVKTDFSGMLTPLSDGNILAVDGHRLPGVLEPGGGLRFLSVGISARGLALSPDQKRVFCLSDNQRLICLSLEMTRPPTKYELDKTARDGAARLETLWEVHLPDTPVCMTYLPEAGVIASSVRLGFVYLHSEEGKIIWKGRFKSDSVTGLAALSGTRLLVATAEPALYLLDLSPVLPQ